MTPRRSLAPALLAVLLLTACGGAPEEIGPQGVDGLEVPTPSPDPADFVDEIDNAWLPLVPGSRWVYDSTGDEGEQETVTVTVTDETRVVAGVTTTVVHDVVTDAAGRVVEDTYDWFAQDTDGNVWYFGEDTTAYEGERRRPTTEGSWEAGVDGAEAGLAMPATPRVGDGYRQEYDAGAAEDQARVLEVGATLTVAGTTYDDLVVTEDTTPLEPGLVEVKYYARGTGLVLEETVSGGGERVELVRARLVASDA